jgi:GT2 family glycosyltransferase
VIESGANLGYGAGNNLGAREARGELLLFLNPDAEPAPGFRDAIERPLADGRGWAAWQGLVTAEEGRVVNTRGGIVHFTCIAWAGGAGEPVPEPGADPAAPGREAEEAAGIGFVSGACLAIPRATFEEVGGFAEDYFLYQEDVDLSLRLRLRGGRLGREPDARVDHAYEFEKGATKWRRLERNRWATIIRTYPAPLLVVVMPALLATELALIPASLAGGWLPQKLASWADVLRALPGLVRARRRIQASAAIGAGQFASALTADLDSSYLGSAARSRVLRSALRAYWRVAVGLLGRG